jgi:hypothetical protein
MSLHKKRITRAAVGVFAIVVSLLASAHGVVLAHGQTTVGDYALEIGFHIEPPYVGEPNGLDLFVTNTKTNEKVNGLEKTLSVEIIRGSHKRTLELYPQAEQDGAYTADLVPTEAGDYTWHVWGQIEGTAVDVSMTSAPDTFDPVKSKSDASFPAAEPGVADLQAQANTALIVGIAGVVLGIVGIGTGVMGLGRARAGKTS